MSRYPNRLIAVLVAVAVGGSMLVVGAPFGSGAAPAQPSHGGSQDATWLRVAHTSPDAPAVDVYVDDQLTLENVSFGTVSDYFRVESGTHTVTITAAGNAEAVVFDGEVSLDARQAVTLAATGEIADVINASEGFEPMVYTDDALAPDENSSVVRVVHLSPDAPAVDVTVTVDGNTTVLADNVTFGDASEYLTVPAGDYTVEIRAATADNDGTVVTTVDLSLGGGTVYTAWAVGYLDPATAPAETPFQMLVTEDAGTTVTLPSTGMGSPTPTGMASPTPTGTAMNNTTA